MADRRTARRRGFTLIEVMVAGLIAALVVSSVAVSLSQLFRSKNGGKERLDGHLRAEAALTSLRRDIISVIRSDDLFFTRLALFHDSARTPWGELDRDEILVFNTRLRPVRDINNFSGEGIEYETQYRIDEDDLGPMLWQRRDTQPDEYDFGGGVATPLIEGIVGLKIEAYDGENWFEEWESDDQGLPFAIRITVTASGHRPGNDAYEENPVVLRTVVPIDRVLAPRDIFDAEEQERIENEAEFLAEQAAEDAAENGGGDLGGGEDATEFEGGGGRGGGGGGAGGGRGGGGRGGGGGGRGGGGRGGGGDRGGGGGGAGGGATGGGNGGDRPGGGGVGGGN